MTGSFAEAVDVADEVLNVRGRVVPVTLDNVHLIMRKRNVKKLIGEYKIGNMTFDLGEDRPALELSPKAVINPEAFKAIAEADIVVIAPGNLYGSIAPALIVDGMKKALEKTHAKIVYVCNLVTKPGQTEGFKVHDFADEIERFIGAKILDTVLYNTEHPDKALLEKYRRDKEFGVEYDNDILCDKHFKPIGASLINKKVSKKRASDKIAASRSFIRHDSDIIARQLMKIYFS
jgi:uncharacterized cofD-like protein